MSRHTKLRSLINTLLITRSPHSTYLLHTQKQKKAIISAPALHDFQIRTGTSDALQLRQALISAFELFEYEVPVAISPRTILDIGANIGIVTVSLAHRFPEARIFAFEPMLENYELLNYNTQKYPQITALPYGLGREREEKDYYLSDNATNWAGGSFYLGKEESSRLHGQLQIVPASEALSENKIDDIDVIKIDTEGAEFDILCSFPEDVLNKVSVIVGELHGVQDDELLQFLGHWFDIEHHHIKGHLVHFKAINRNISDLQAQTGE